jgi:hypothetical protein
MSFLTELKQRARHLKEETFALYFAVRDPRTPWYAKLLVAGIVAYAFSPIDLIPDFVPVLGQRDNRLQKQHFRILLLLLRKCPAKENRGHSQNKEMPIWRS